jgi:hypothetical protein
MIWTLISAAISAALTIAAGILSLKHHEYAAAMTGVIAGIAGTIAALTGWMDSRRSRKELASAIRKAEQDSTQAMLDAVDLADRQRHSFGA